MLVQLIRKVFSINTQSHSSRPHKNVSKVKSANFIAQAHLSDTNDKKLWVFDTAATHHFCRDKELFVKYFPLKSEELKVAINGVTVPIEGKGVIKLRFGQRNLYLKDVMHSSELRKNLLSGPKFDRMGMTFTGEKGKVKIFENNQHLFTAVLRNGVYSTYPKILRSLSKNVKFSVASAECRSIAIWHRRLAHVGPETIEKTCRNNSVRGLPKLKNRGFKCEICRLNKQRRVSFKSVGGIRSKAPLELLHMDTWGPCKDKGRNGETYFLSIVDDYSRRVSIYPIRDKTEVFRVFRNHVARAERFLERKLKAIRTDNGTEFKNRAFQEYCEENGIKHEVTNTYTPEENGVAERFNQTVADACRCLLGDSGLPNKFWPEAMSHFVYTWNRVCHRNQTKTPFELYGGNKPSIRHLKPFGIAVYVGVPKQHRSKLDAKARKGILVGYAFRTKGYRVFIPELNKVIETINLTFGDEIPCDGENASGAVMGPYFENSEDEDDEDDDKSSHSETQDSSDEESSIPDKVDSKSLKRVNWVRKPKIRKDRSRTDIYYYEEGKEKRFKSLKEIEKHCIENQINFEPSIFDFSSKNKFKGVIKDIEEEIDTDSETEEADTSHTQA